MYKKVRREGENLKKAWVAPAAGGEGGGEWCGGSKISERDPHEKEEKKKKVIEKKIGLEKFV